MPNHKIDRMAGLSGAAVASHGVSNLATGGAGHRVIARVGGSYGVLVTMALVPVMLAALCYGLVEGADSMGPFKTLFNLLGAICGILAVLTEIALFPFQVLAAWKTLVLLVKGVFKLAGAILFLPKRVHEDRMRKELVRQCNEGRALIAAARKGKA